MLSDVRLRERAKVSIEYWSENFLIDLSRQISSKNGYSEQQIWTQLLFLFRSGRALVKKRWTLFAIEASDKINSTPLPAQPHFQFLQAPLEGQWTLEQINGARAKQFLRFWNSQLLTSDGLDKNWTYDSFYGLVGLGSYALNHRSTQNGRRLIQNVARQLRQTAQPHRYGSYWPVSPKVFQHAPRSMSHNDNVALGMAHGISGVVSFLCLAAKAKIDRHQNLDLAQRAVGFMLNLESEMKFEAFPEYVDFKKSRFVHKGAVWCGGDMAVGNALSLLAEELDGSC